MSSVEPSPELLKNAVEKHMTELMIFGLLSQLANCNFDHLNAAFGFLNEGYVEEARNELRLALVHHASSLEQITKLLAERDRLNNNVMGLAQQETTDARIDTDPVSAKLAADFLKKL